MQGKIWSLKKLSFVQIVLWALSIFSIFFLDARISHYLKENLDKVWVPYVKIISAVGLGDAYFLVSLGGYFFFRYLEQKKGHSKFAALKDQFLFVFNSFLFSGISVLILKMMVGRERPYHNGAADVLSFVPFNFDWNYQSYPSGHSQVAFTMAMTLSFIWPKQKLFFWICAILIAISRIILEFHYLSDTLAGAAVGIAGSYFVSAFFIRKRANQ